jgi:hypothetical protein
MIHLPDDEGSQGMLEYLLIVVQRCISLWQRVQRGILISFLLYLLALIFFTTSPKARAQQWDTCTPSPEVKRALDAIPKQPPNQTDWEFHQKEIEVIQNLRKQHPDDIFVERRYVELMLDHPAAHREIIAEYKNKFATTPNSPLAAYLYGFALLSRESVTLFSGALKSDPKFPWPHIPLVWIYSAPLFRDQSKVDAHIKAFLEECPASFDGYEVLSTRGEDKELIRKGAAQLRAQLMRREDADAIAAYRTLWALEFKATASSEYERLRKQAARDVLRIRALNMQGTRKWYDTLEEGYKLFNDQQNSDWAKNERDLRFPSPQGLASMGSWFEDHHPPNKDDSEEIRRAYNKQLIQQTDGWIQERPNSPYIWRTRLDAMTQLSETMPTEIERAANQFIQAAEKNAGPEGASSGDYFMAAQALSRKHLQPGRIADMAKKGLKVLEIEQDEQERYSWLADKEGAAELAFYQTSENLDGLDCLAQAYIDLKQADEAQITLSRMDERLQELKSFASDKNDRKEAYLEHLSAYWDHMGRLAELQQRKIDAMGFYENALLARLEAKQKPVPGEKDELAENAKKLWSSLGGTSEGWTMWYSRRANELARSVTLHWEDANEPLAPFELADLNGNLWSVESLRGKVTFLNFWASW